jgi:UDP-glucose:(galactosyl)LPS alpha-1,2-glucosyltransferase
MSRSVPVVFAFDDRVVRPAAVALMSLMESALPDTRYEIHILHPGFDVQVMEAYAGLVAATRHSIDFHRVDPSRFAGLPAGRGSWTDIVYYRFAIPEVLGNRDRAIYSDMDVFFMGDLSSLMDLDMRQCPLGAVIGEVNGPSMQCHTYFPENTASHVFMSGFLLMDLDRMRKEGVARGVLEAARAYRTRLRMFDLEAMNLACERILPLPFEYCVLETIHEARRVEDAPEYPWLAMAHGRERLEQAKADPIVVHYAGRLGKPWRRPDPPGYYQAMLDRVPGPLNRRTMRDLRKYWAGKLAAWFRGAKR